MQIAVFLCTLGTTPAGHWNLGSGHSITVSREYKQISK